MNAIDSNLFMDPQQAKDSRCPACGKNVYPPTYYCPRCRRESP